MTKIKKKVVALLPMKANSQRVKGKNFKNFNGKPLFKWVLDTLLSIDCISKVVINTDARNIIMNNGIIENNKIIIRDRPTEICGDSVSMNRIIKNDIDNIEADAYLMTHTTNPLIQKETIEKAITSYNNKLELGYDSLFSVNKIQTRFYDINCKPINHDLNNLIQTQDLEPWFEENSNLYIFSKNSFNLTNNRIGKNPHMFISDPLESYDIDEPSDWELAELRAKNFYNMKSK